jgi:hypothetical protein
MKQSLLSWDFKLTRELVMIPHQDQRLVDICDVVFLGQAQPHVNVGDPAVSVVK